MERRQPQPTWKGLCVMGLTEGAQECEKIWTGIDRELRRLFLKANEKSPYDESVFILACTIWKWVYWRTEVILAQLHDMEGHQQTIYGKMLELQKQVNSIQESMKDLPLVVKVIELPRHGYVYVVKADNGLYKIGKAKKPAMRIQTLGVKLPYVLDTVLLIESGNYSMLERELHQRFADKRLSGEWFALTPEDLEYLRGLDNGKVATEI